MLIYRKITLLFVVALLVVSTVLIAGNPQQKEKTKEKHEAVKATKEKPITAQDTVKKTAADVVTDTVSIDKNLKFKFYKKNAHASYYHSRFEGKRTASGKRFSNRAYTAAHKKLPFGTKVRVTNEANGRSVVVEITDRGPFSKAREIDLSKRSFMELVDNKNSGSVIVKLEIEDK